MAKERSELQWQNVNVAELAVRTIDLYQASKDAYRVYKAAKDAFEAAMQADYVGQLPAQAELKFGYMFGKLSIAVGPISERKVKAKPAGTLADWLAAQGERAV